jgi:hypothetical protein
VGTHLLQRFHEESKEDEQPINLGRILRLRHNSWSWTATKKRTRSFQIRPTGSGILLRASRHNTSTSRQNPQLIPRLESTPRLHLLRTASPPTRASGWPSAERTTLNGGRWREPSREGREKGETCINSSIGLGALLTKKIHNDS